MIRPRLILQNPDKLSQFLIELGPHAPIDILNRYSEQPGGYYAGLISALLDEVCRIQVYKDDSLLIPFAVPTVDDEVQELLTLGAFENEGGT